jgi:hypothetical protein
MKAKRAMTDQAATLRKLMQERQGSAESVSPVTPARERAGDESRESRENFGEASVEARNSAKLKRKVMDDRTEDLGERS